MLSFRGILRGALVAFFSLPLIIETFGAPLTDSTTSTTTHLEPRGLKILAALGAGGYLLHRKKEKKEKKKLKKELEEQGVRIS